jgi:hypothetical protein
MLFQSIRGEVKMQIKSLTLGCLATGLLISAPQAMAQSVDAFLVVGVQSASGNVTVTEDLCMKAVIEIIGQGFDLQSTSAVGGNGGPDLSSFVFTQGFPAFDVATLFCIADIQDGDGLGDLNDPGHPGRGLGRGRPF